MQTGFIYLVTNLVNGKRYVGQTTRTLALRWNDHKTACNRGSDGALHRAMRKYGPESFTIEPLVTGAVVSSLNDLEMFYVKQYTTHTSNHGYNMTPGGDGLRLSGPNHNWWGQHHSEETKRKISESNKGRIISIEQRQHLSRLKTGMKCSPETVAKVASANRGKKRSEDFKLEMTGEGNPFFGKKHSDDSLAKMRKPRSEAGKQAMRDGWARHYAGGAKPHNLGKRSSAETRQKLRDAWIVRKARSIAEKAAA